ncbi:MAG: nucleotide-binding universal stress UspA family protein [Candidatus Paceibacteria bacterium]|jgi:nucleotide-binding universal stress UspA family protein
MKHILIATDLSPDALRPLAMVADLARSWGARVTLLNVVQDLVIAPHGALLAPPISSPDLPQMMAAASQAMEKTSEEWLDGIEVQHDVVIGERIPTAISSYAAEHDVDLIALSTHGRTGWRHLALGSVAEAVLRHSNVPVITFPRKSD